MRRVEMDGSGILASADAVACFPRGSLGAEDTAAVAVNEAGLGEVSKCF